MASRRRTDQPRFSYPQAETYNFLGLEQPDYKQAKVVVFPVPYNSTTYWTSGTKNGPRALIDASRRVERYDHELGMDLSEIPVYTLGELEVSKNSPKETLTRIEDVVRQILKSRKFPLVLGGEHSITYGPVAACTKKYRKLSVLQLDAHDDLRDEFEGTKYHHGCVMRRIVDDLGLPITQVGLRSLSEDGARFLKKPGKGRVFYAPEMPIEEIVGSLMENVYVTFDLDFFDPSIMPATGTPEPGGYSWYDALKILRRVCQERNIVGADIVELAPIPGMHAPDFLAAKLACKLIGYVTEGKGR